MDEVMYTNTLKVIATTSGIAGILIGLDLVFGAPVITNLKRVFDKYFDFDKIIISSGAKRGLGIVFSILGVIMLLLISRV
jgi:hypothetical protein